MASGSWQTAVKRRLSLSGDVKFSQASAGITLHVPCEKGDHIVDVTVPLGFHPEGISKRMLNAGWTIGNKPICPEHSRREKVETKPAGLGDKIITTKMIAAVSNGNNGIAVTGNEDFIKWGQGGVHISRLDVQRENPLIVLTADLNGGFTARRMERANGEVYGYLQFQDGNPRLSKQRRINALFGNTKPVSVTLTKGNQIEIELPPLAQCAPPLRKKVAAEQLPAAEKKEEPMPLPEPVRDLAAEAIAEAPKPIIEAAPPVATVPAPERSENAKIAFRLVMAALDEHYDDSAKTYRPGWDDARIAKDTGAALAVVAKTREEYFGPVGMPPAFGIIAEELRKLEAEERAAREAFAKRIAELHVRLSAVAKAHGWTLPIVGGQ